MYKQNFKKLIVLCAVLIANTISSAQNEATPGYWPERMGDFVNLTICLAPILAAVGIEAGLSALYTQAVPLKQFEAAAQRLEEYVRHAKIALDTNNIRVTGISTPIACYSGIILPIEYQTALESADADMNALVATITQAIA